MRKWRLIEETWHSEILDDKDKLVFRNDLSGQTANSSDMRLVAAAPELLESLIETLSCIDQHTDDKILGPIIETAKQVIKKARGG